MDRRLVIGGGLASTLSANAYAAVEPAAFTHGPLADEAGAKRFRAPPQGLSLPSTPLFDMRSKHHLGELKGKVRLISLWAEWCAPCIAEMADLAALNSRFSARGFEVLAVLTSSQAKLNYADAASLLERKGAVLPLWIEANGGAEVFESLAKRDKEGSLPCSVLVDARGIVRARSFGAAILSGGPSHLAAGTQLSDADKAKLVSGSVRTAWSSEATLRFVEALLGGGLDR